MKTPRSIEVAITGSCNLRCSYCSHFSGGGDSGTDLTTEQWLAFFDELGAAAVMDITISGGEPFMRKDIKELIQGIVKNRMRFSMLSNGALITEELAQFLKETKRCSSVQVSMDGATAEIHDASRGKGAYDGAIRGIKNLQNAGIPVTVRVTLNKHNLESFPATAKLLLEELGLPSFSTNSASHFGLCRENADDIALDVDEYSRALQIAKEMKAKYGNRIGAAAGPFYALSDWNRMLDAHNNHEKQQPNCGNLLSCGCVFSKLSVTADGRYVPCIQMSEDVLGQVGEDTLVDVWQKSTELNGFRDRVEIPLGTLDSCKGCEYIPYCRGGCPATAQTITGSRDTAAPDSCLRNFLELGGKVPSMN
jgi:SynChlorMet cassette radical SAM/SPASM protein ScmE